MNSLSHLNRVPASFSTLAYKLHRQWKSENIGSHSIVTLLGLFDSYFDMPQFVIVFNFDFALWISSFVKPLLEEPTIILSCHLREQTFKVVCVY